MNKLCKDCSHCLWAVSNTEEILFFSDDGPWCREALSRMRRTEDHTNGGYSHFTKQQLNEADVKLQRRIPIVFDVLVSMCGRRGRWFKPKEAKE